MLEHINRFRDDGSVANVAQFIKNSFVHGIINLFTDYRTSTYYWRKIAQGLINASSEARKKLESSLAIPERNANDAFFEIDSVPITLVDYQIEYGEMPLHELLILCRIARAKNPKTIFEIGTYLGGTTLQLAANSRAQIFTLDLPADDIKNIVDEDLDVYPESPGSKFQDNTIYNGRIKQLIGNSLTYDFAPYYGKFDLILVDGCHRYDHVVRDSRNALNMKSEDGLVLWHDYAEYAPGVVQALEEIKDRHLVHISNTSLVCCF